LQLFFVDDSANAKKILTVFPPLEETARTPSDHMDEDSSKWPWVP